MISKIFIALLVVLPHLLNYQVFAMFQNAYRYGRLPREGKEAVRSPGVPSDFLAGSFEVAWEAIRIDIGTQRAGQLDGLTFVDQNSLLIGSITFTGEDEWVISTWLRHIGNINLDYMSTLQFALGNLRDMIDAHIHRYREILNLQTQYWRELSRSYPEDMSPVLRQDLDKAIDEISRTGADSQASERLAHYALVFAEMTSIDGPFPKLQSCIREYIIKKLDPILSSLHPPDCQSF
ncbi:hypothetical protein PSHT_14973 [Puccinia striiformis]|uniref:Uncharacterized protein n=1 Tax=Puccinia striiformis TaxID=27350 RepID=A0A2S4UHS6_9BASI|nr:hypothetical protein PSHT_14973 [Puccinia striiformis]